MMSSSNGAQQMSNIYRNLQSPSDAKGHRNFSSGEGRINKNGRTMEINMTPRMHEQNKGSMTHLSSS